MSSQSNRTAHGRPSSGGEDALATGTFRAVAILGGVAAGIHLGVAPEHFGEWWGYGTLSVLAAVGECTLVALVALRPRAWVIQAGIWASLATMLLYLVSRTSGMPLGPATGVVEPLDIPGLGSDCRRGCARRRALRIARRPAARAHAEHPRPGRRGALDRRARRCARTPRAATGEPHAGHLRAPLVHAGMGVPFIPDSVRNAPRLPGEG